MKKLHYFNLVFMYDNNDPNVAVGYISAYVGLGYRARKRITKHVINKAKEAAGIDKNIESILLSCDYLGKMTEKEMNEGVTHKILQFNGSKGIAK